MKNRQLEFTKSRFVNSLDELKDFAKEIVSNFSEREVVLLKGPMGAGKTQLVCFLVEIFGGGGSCSPTFSIHQSYDTDRGRVDHVDLYRLKNDYDLETTGFWELFSLPKGVVLVEWADRMSGDWVDPRWEISAISIDVLERSDSSGARRVKYKKWRP